MSRASEAFEALSLAMTGTEPACLGIDGYTADTVPADDMQEFAAICDSCPLFELCRTYADLERPKIGYWAGKTYRTYKTGGIK
jgi:hypothetical protein